MKLTIKQEFEEHVRICENTIDSLQDEIKLAANTCINSLNNQGKIILFGNGGSAADAQHIAAELVGRYKAVRKSLPAIALTTDTSILTCIGNDYGFEKIFERQIEALANKNDVVIGISTSGISMNVINAIKSANKIGCQTIGFSGNGGGEMSDSCNINIAIPSSNTPRIQEMHTLAGHIICQLIDQEFTNH